MFSNCYKYNPPDHEVVAMARKLQVNINKSSQQLCNAERLILSISEFLFCQINLKILYDGLIFSLGIQIKILKNN